MILRPDQAAIAYRCPECGGFVHSIVGVFSLTGELIRLKCGCGKSELSMRNIGDRIQLNIPCFICEKEHIYTVSRSALFSSNVFSFSCTFTGVDICFVGSEVGVESSIKTADRELEQLMRENEIDDFFSRDERYEESVDYTAVTAAVSVIKELAADGKIHCGCTERANRRKKPADDLLSQAGSYENSCFGDFMLKDEDGRLVLKCMSCGCEYVIPLGHYASSPAFDSFLLCDDIYLI